MRLVLSLFLYSVPAVSWAAADPFAGVAASSAPAAAPEEHSWARRFFSDNFGVRRELMSEFGAANHVRSSSRQSAGFEVLKKFSTETRTVAALNFQGRLVRRDRFTGSPNDMEGMQRQGWFFEYHNAYADLYDPLGGVGALSARAGRFYVPFGLNLQTDTHGTLLQLSNERNFGFERDWYAGVWGSAGEELRYDAYYLAGSGYDLKYWGQSGLGAARLSLASKYANEHGIEGGLSFLGGQRLAPGVVDTLRSGLDGRLRRPVPTGTLSWTTELSGGEDRPASVFTQLHQLEYLHSSRRWGLASQYRRFWMEGRGSDGSLFGEAGWYFRNDVGNSNLHWLKLNVERQMERQEGPLALIVKLQYYRYW